VNRNGQLPVTRAELRAELRRLATKDDLKKLATKEELKKLATKEELKKLATKEELEKLATKFEREFQDVRMVIARETMKLQIRIERVEETMETMATKADVERIITAIDGLSAHGTAAWNKLTMHDERIRRLEVTTYGVSPPPPEP
jgi:hypothetical protein